MLLLILAHGHEVGLVEQDIGGHEGGVGKEAGIDIVGVLGGFVLKLGHAGELAEHGVAVQHPCKLAVGRHMGLDKEDALLRVKTAGNIVGQEHQGAAAQLRRVLTDGDGVLVGQEEVTVKLLNHIGPMAQRPQIVAQMQIAAGLNAGDHDFFCTFHIKHLNKIAART